jgi:Lactate racemase N-terminal domain
LRLTKIRQRFERKALPDPIIVAREQLTRLDDLIPPDARIAIAVGSRGIDNLQSIVKEVVAYVQGRGARPFIVPAMGSHGGATAEGQTEVLRSYGVSEETVQAPVHATMGVVDLHEGDLPFRVYIDRNAFESAGVILINRIKPHTDFHGRYESGLMKMALIGLGKQEGALAIHQFGVYGLREFIEPGARRVLASGKILGGVALVEDAYHRTMCVKVLKTDEIPDGESRLLALARANMPALPAKTIDVLVVDRMGKDISGVGMDPNITGRFGVNGEHDTTGPQIGAMIVCDLTDQSRGNAIGVGLADIITQRLYDKIERQATYANVITSSFLERGKIPVAAPTDRDAFAVACRSCAQPANGRARIVRILDTLHLEDVYVSPAVLDELRDATAIEVIERDVEMFDASGSLRPF